MNGHVFTQRRQALKKEKNQKGSEENTILFSFSISPCARQRKNVTHWKNLAS